MTARISAVVPCFETGGLLLRAVESLRAQTTPPVEILVVDDGSTGKETLDALDAAAATPSVSVIRVGENRGVANARNTGLDAAAGDYAVFLDADDMFTAPSLEAFVAAIRATNGRADFAYPTVTCFGNRTDTFAPPPFNAYLEHHVNIVPIGSMVTRRAIDCGVRFDGSIDVGHEDWDYWLRLIDSGLEGCACPGATLLYRRVGFTRMDLGNEVEGGFDRLLREIRPALFAGRRLARIKRRWAPAVSILAADVDEARRAVAGQTCTDAEVLPGDALDRARGQVVALAREPADIAWLRDAWALDEILGMFMRHGVQAVVTLAHGSCRPGTATASVLAGDLLRGCATASDIAAFALTRAHAQRLGRDAGSIRERLVSALPLDAARAPHEIAWRSSGPPSRDDAGPLDWHDDDPLQPPHEWSRDVLSRLAPATSANAAGAARGLFGAPHPSAFQETIETEGPEGDRTLYLPDERIPLGRRVTGHGPILLRSDARGATALLRTIDHRTGRRGIGVEPLPNGVTPERVVGFMVDAPEPGATALDAPGQQGGVPVRLGWQWGPPPDDEWGDHLLRPMLDQVRIWRGTDQRTGVNVYETSLRRLRRAGARPLGPVFAIWTVPDAVVGSAAPVFPRLRDGLIIGLERRDEARTGLPLGFMASGGDHPLREIFTAQAQDGSLVHSAVEADATGKGVRRLASLGFTTW